MYEIRGLHLIGISYNPVYRAFKGTFVVIPISLLPPILNAQIAPLVDYRPF
jgi:hypothetical protein